MTDADRWQAGLDVVDKVYGAGSSAMMEGQQSDPFVAETVNHLFAEIWSRPGLSMRDKRLLVLGAASMLGRPDLIAIQIAGAIVNGELSETELQEIPLLMMFYAGTPNTTALFNGIKAGRERAKTLKPAAG
jgi:4-carboxymuconolactone decarboxylase